MSIKKSLTKFKNDQAQAGSRAFLEDLFEDYYRNRFKIYRMNLVRGIMFGFGSIIGASIIVTLLLWVMSFFNELPFIGHFVQSAQNSVQQVQKR